MKSTEQDNSRSLDRRRSHCEPWRIIGSFCLLGIFLFLGCGEKKEPTIAVVGEQEVGEKAFLAYLRFKRIPADDKARFSRELDNYLERKAVARAIEAEETADHELFHAELEEFKKEMLISRYFEKYLAAAVTEQEVTKYYNAHASEYEAKKVKVAHILFRTNKKMGETEKQAQLTKAMEAKTKIEAQASFEDVAAELSEDKISAKKGGDIGWIQEGSIAPELSEKAFSLKAGEVSDPFETKFGYHILKVLEGPKVIRQPLRSVQGDIRHKLRAEAKKKEMERLKSKVKVEKRRSK